MRGADKHPGSLLSYLEVLPGTRPDVRPSTDLTTRHPGYATSRRIRKCIEEDFGWIKTVAGSRKTKYRGLERVRWAFTLPAAAYNLIRLSKSMSGE